MRALEKKRVAGNPYVFPGKAAGQYSRPGTRLQNDIKAESGIGDFHFHAVRHTVETRLAELGVAPHIRDLVLDHAPNRGAGKGYDHHSYRSEMLDALTRWQEHIVSVLRRKKVRAENVEPLAG